MSSSERSATGSAAAGQEARLRYDERLGRTDTDLRIGADIAVTLHQVALDRHELARAALDSPIPMSRQLASAYQ